MHKIASITAIVVGILMAIAGVVTFVVVSTTLWISRSPSPKMPRARPGMA